MQPVINPQDLSVLGLAIIINFLIIFFFCKSLIKALSFVNPENRTLSNNTIWLLLIPGVHFIANFFVIIGMSKSIEKELNSRNFEEVKKPVYTLGMTYAILSLIPITTLLPIPSSLAPVIGVAGFSQIFFFVQYWMKINWYKTVFENDEAPVNEN